MTRRKILFGFFVGASVAVAQSTHVDVPKLWNEFAEEGNAWATMRRETPEGAYSWPAKRQWDMKVRPAFKAVDVGVKNE